MTEQTKRAIGIGALCAGGMALLCHPATVFSFGAGVWAGPRVKDWIQRILEQREASL